MIVKMRAALPGIIVEDIQKIDKLSGILHDFVEYIIIRMGIPYSKKGLNIADLDQLNKEVLVFSK